MKNLIFLIIITFSHSVIAEQLESENDAREFANTVMKYIAKEKIKKAFEIAKLNWPIPKVEVDNLVNTIEQQWPIVSNRFGKSIEYEFIRKERIGKSFLRYYYLHKFKNHAMYWRIDFYKPNKIWKVNRIDFKDKLDILYE